MENKPRVVVDNSRQLPFAHNSSLRGVMMIKFSHFDAYVFIFIDLSNWAFKLTFILDNGVVLRNVLRFLIRLCLSRSSDSGMSYF
jgi:hypothetical protein